MPAKSGASHALAAFTTVVLGAVISNVLNAHSREIRDVSAGIGSLITSATGVDVPSSLAGLAVVATLLSFLWGVAYHYARHGGE